MHCCRSSKLHNHCKFVVGGGRSVGAGMSEREGDDDDDVIDDDASSSDDNDGRPPEEEGDGSESTSFRINKAKELEAKEKKDDVKWTCSIEEEDTSEATEFDVPTEILVDDAALAQETLMARASEREAPAEPAARIIVVAVKKKRHRKKSRATVSGTNTPDAEKKPNMFKRTVKKMKKGFGFNSTGNKDETTPEKRKPEKISKQRKQNKETPSSGRKKTQSERADIAQAVARKASPASRTQSQTPPNAKARKSTKHSTGPKSTENETTKHKKTHTKTKKKR